MGGGVDVDCEIYIVFESYYRRNFSIYNVNI